MEFTIFKICTLVSNDSSTGMCASGEPPSSPLITPLLGVFKILSSKKCGRPSFAAQGMEGMKLLDFMAQHQTRPWKQIVFKKKINQRLEPQKDHFQVRNLLFEGSIFGVQNVSFRGCSSQKKNLFGVVFSSVCSRVSTLRFYFCRFGFRNSILVPTAHLFESSKTPGILTMGTLKTAPE